MVVVLGALMGLIGFMTGVIEKNGTPDEASEARFLYGFALAVVAFALFF